MLKNPAKYERYFTGKIYGHFSSTFLLLRYLMSLLVTTRELWWMKHK
jgi:hypothetical protein